MKFVSIKNLSLLGLLLIVVSVVAATVLPKNKSKQNRLSGKFVLNSTGCGPMSNILTCKEKPLFGVQTECDFTVTDGQNSFTSEGGECTSDDAVTTGHGIQIDHNMFNYSNTGIIWDNDINLYVSEKYETRYYEVLL